MSDQRSNVSVSSSETASIWQKGINLSDLFLLVTCSVESLIILTVKGQLFWLGKDRMDHPWCSLHSVTCSLTAFLNIVLCQLQCKTSQNVTFLLHLCNSRLRQSAQYYYFCKWFNIYCRPNGKAVYSCEIHV